jgi:hypothetical protein
VAGFHTLTEWQDSQRLVEMMCAAFLPVALTLLWQLEHPVVMPACVNVDGRQASVAWQALQFWEVGMWLAGLPVADVPLWHAEQVPCTCV